MTKQIRISLDYSDFDKLTSGEIIELNEHNVCVRISLQDIGYLNMIHLLEEKYEEMVKGKK